MNIEVADACNLNCSSCMRPRDGHTFMRVATFKKILGKLKPSGWIILHWRGEPCLHPLLPQLTVHAKQLGWNPYLSTNCSVPNLGKPEWTEKLLSGLDKIEVCVDGWNQETLSRYRVGADWNQLMKNVETIGATRADTIKEMRVLMFRYNDDKEPFFRKLAKKNGFDVVSFAQPLINLKQTLNEKEVSLLLSKHEKYQRYTEVNGVWRHRGGECTANGTAISVKGTVHVCCFDWNLQYNIGDALKDDWDTIKKNFRVIIKQFKTKPPKMCRELCCIPEGKVDYREEL